MPIHSSPARHGNGLCLLSFDAGGSRGISQLKVLAEMMHRMNFGVPDDSLNRPCSVFDMIGGVGSGGFIAILLVTLGFTAEEALDEFISLSVNVLDKLGMDTQARTATLKNHVRDLLNKHGIDPKTHLLDPSDHSRGCKLVIPISYKRHVESICTLRNYPVRQEQSLNLTIVEALLATLATPPLFESISIIKDSGTFEYIGAEMTLSNPMEEIIAEAHGAFGADKRVACILSLGCGHPGVLNVSESSELGERIRLLENLIMDAQRKAQNLESRMGELGVYHRFSVNSGLERRNSATILDPGEIVTHTKGYLDDVPISRKLDTCVNSVRARDGVSSLEQLKSSGGKSVFSPRLPPVTKTFVMRKEPWDLINQIIFGPRKSQDTDEPRMLVVTGIGGCGKTQLMLRFMKVHRERFTSLFFIDGSSEDRIRADIIRNVRALGNEHSQKGFDDCLPFLSQPSGDNMRFLLYDNVDDPNLDLLPLLPQGDSCAIAITSRNHILGDLYPESHLSLDVMSTNEAIELLLDHSVSITDEVRKEAIALAQALGYLPIALQQARSYMQQAKCTIKNYLVRLSSSRARLLGQAIKHQIDMQAISTYAAFETSFERLTPHAKKLLWLLAYFHWSSFPLELVMHAVENNFAYETIHVKSRNEIRAGKKKLEDIFLLDGKWDVIHLDEMIVSLQSYSLVTVVPGVDTSLLQIHPLMHEWLVSSITKDERSTYQDAVVLLLALGECQGHTAATQYLSSHVLHLRSLWDQLGINDAAAFGTILHKNGLFQAALYLREAIVKKLVKQVAPDNIELSNSIWDLALTYQASGRLNEAANLQQEVVNLNKRVLGERHPDTLMATNNLANTYRDLGQPKKAKKLQEEVLKLRKIILGEQHPHTIQSSNNLALTYHDLGRLKEAQVLQEEVIKISKDILGERHPDTIMALNNLAFTYSNLGRLDEAQVLQEEVLRLRKDVLGERHPDTLMSSNNLALTYSSLGRLKEALSLQEEVLKLRKDILGERHPDTIMAFNNVAYTYGSLGRLVEAQVLQEEVLKLSKDILGEQHPDTILASENLAFTYANLGRLKEAQILQEEALKLRRDTLGEQHPATIMASNDLALTYANLGRLKDARFLQEKGLKARRELSGESHPDTVEALITMATIYRHLGLLSEAEALLVTALTTSKEALGTSHPYTLNASHDLAITHRDQGRFEEALVEIERVLKARKEIQGDSHPRTILASSDLATVLHRLGRLNEAETLTTEAVRLWTEKFGVRHPDTLIASTNLASIYCDLGRLEEAEALQLRTLDLMRESLGKRHYKTASAMLVLSRIYKSCRRKVEALKILATAEATISDVLGMAHAQYLECQKLKEEAQSLPDLVQALQGETELVVESSTDTS